MTHQNAYLKDKYNNPHKSYEYRAKRNRASFGKATLWILAGLFVLYLFNYRSINDVYAVMSYDGPEAMRELANGSGLNMHGRALFFATNPQYVDANTMSTKCEGGEKVILYGCYTPSDNRIYILELPEGYKDAEYTTAAHEMLHAAWQNELSTSRRDELRKELDIILNEYPAQDQIVETLLNYDKEDTFTYSSEIHSLIGTQSVSLSSTLTAHYDAYFSSRYESVSRHQAFEEKVDGQVESLNSRLSELEALKGELDQYKKDHLDSFDYYFNLALLYGDTYNYNQNVKAYNNNRDIYNAKVDTYNEKLESYRADYEAFSEVFESLYPTKNNPTNSI